MIATSFTSSGVVIPVVIGNIGGAGQTFTPDLNAGRVFFVQHSVSLAWTLADPVNPPGPNTAIVWYLYHSNQSGGAGVSPTLSGNYHNGGWALPGAGQTTVHCYISVGSQIYEGPDCNVTMPA